FTAAGSIVRRRLLDQRQAGAAGGRLALLLQQLVERQVHDVAAALGGDQHLGCGAQHLFHGFEIEALAGDARRARVLGEQLGEARALALGLGDHFGAVSFRVLDAAGGRTAGARHDVVGVLLRFQFQPFLVLARLDGVTHRRLHWRREVGVLQVHGSHFQAGAIVVQRLLHELARLLRDLGAACAEDEIEVVAADDLADGALGDIRQRLVGVAHIEEIRGRIAAAVLHGEIDGDDVLVLGEHLRTVREARDLADVDLVDGLDRPRQVPVQARRRGGLQLAETQYHTGLGGIDLVQAGSQPAQRQYGQQQADDGTVAGRHLRVAATAAEQPRQLTLQVAYQLIEVRRVALAAAAATAPGILVALSRLIPGHDALREYSWIRWRRTADCRNRPLPPQPRQCRRSCSVASSDSRA